jgi:hypothetical protein
MDAPARNSSHLFSSRRWLRVGVKDVTGSRIVYCRQQVRRLLGCNTVRWRQNGLEQY